MARRHREEGPSLESDSFLDVVANIVGILIILIVIVGVRVGQSASEPGEPVGATEPAHAPVVAPRPVIVRIPAALPIVPEPSSELLAALDSAASETDRLRRERLALSSQAEELDSSVAAVSAEADDASVAQIALADRLDSVEREGQIVVAELDDLRSTLAGLGRQIADAPAEKVTVLKHRLNPIGREVRGDELHFRLAEGRVARVPIDELVARLKPEIERQKEWIARYRRHQGRIGPIEGFSMDYVVERERLGVVEELRYGVQMMRIGVTGWKVTPDAGLVTESVDEALRSESRFMSALRLADEKATLTFWVYPDSFAAYRRLQEFAHEEGFDVAARPLPHGVPIAGSPNGSRSSSQ